MRILRVGRCPSGGAETHRILSSEVVPVLMRVNLPESRTGVQHRSAMYWDNTDEN